VGTKKTDKWASLVDRKCLACSKSFKVQYQAIQKKNGGEYCRKCNPRFAQPTKNPLGSVRDIVDAECPTCHTKFRSKVKNINRGGGKYCSKKCNPHYMAKFLPSEKYRRYNLKKYGITQDIFNEMVEKQNGLCAICKMPQAATRHKGVLFIDHCHTSGKVRGLLCSHCNWGIGHFRDDIALMEAAITYLRER